MMSFVTWIRVPQCWGLVALLACFTLGCGEEGPERAAVSGKVSINGQPLPEGVITFVPAEGTVGPTTGAKIENGAYTIAAEQGAVIGKHRVEITSTQKTGKQIPAGSPHPEGTMVDEIKQIVPRNYNLDSTLTADIQAGMNENVDFDLEVAPR